MLAGGNGLVNFAEQYMDSGLTALTVATSPTWAAILGALFFANTERLDKWSVVGILLATLGIYVLHHEQSERFRRAVAGSSGRVGLSDCLDIGITGCAQTRRRTFADNGFGNSDACGSGGVCRDFTFDR